MKKLAAIILLSAIFTGCSNWNIANQPTGARTQSASQTTAPANEPSISGVTDKVQEVSNDTVEMVEENLPDAGAVDAVVDKSDAFHINQVISAWNKQPDSIRTTANNGNIYTWKNYKPCCDVSLTSDSEGYVPKSAISSAISKCL